MIYRLLTRRKNRLYLALLEEVATLLEQRGIEYWLDWGTLLGAWRGQGFLAHDTDVDVAVPDRYRDELLQRPLEGSWSARDGGDSIFLKRPGHPSLDTLADLLSVQICFVQELDRALFHLSSPRPLPRTAVRPLGRIAMAGRQWPAPRDPGRYLAALYGHVGPYCVYLGDDRYRACSSLRDYAEHHWNHLLFYPAYFSWKALPLPRAWKESFERRLKPLYTRVIAEPKT